MAVAVSPMELLRPESDLARLVEGFPHVDLLVTAEDPPVAAPGTVSVLPAADAWDDDLDDDADDVDDDDVDHVREDVARLELPGLHLHRLGLRQPLDGSAEGDVIAALSELVGFDPEPGLYGVAPAPGPADPSRAVVHRAAQRIAQVYGIPLLRYRCLELSVVGDEPA
ncbi:hypothetical protein [Pseudonocardia nigra]|uniref:hypothetical protein n=1 Tax=Pseudonocardia nigra TaxID=1921578 RepID=UPI001C5FFB0F|nr:hypothetical protein [Pseudonocardia nigra]